jgi:hypothetical protein
LPLTLERLARTILLKPSPGRFFSLPEQRALEAVAEILLEDSPVRITKEEVARNVDAFFKGERSNRAWRVRVLAQLVEILPLALPEYRRTFSNLSREARKKLVRERFIGGRHIFGICSNIRLIVYIGLYGDERAEAAVGFVPVPLRDRYRMHDLPRARSPSNGKAHEDRMR